MSRHYGSTSECKLMIKMGKHKFCTLLCSQSETLSDAGSTGMCDCLETIIIVVVDANFLSLSNGLFISNNNIRYKKVRKGIQSILLLHNWDLHVFFLLFFFC